LTVRYFWHLKDGDFVLRVLFFGMLVRSTFGMWSEKWFNDCCKWWSKMITSSIYQIFQLQGKHFESWL